MKDDGDSQPHLPWSRRLPAGAIVAFVFAALVALPSLGASAVEVPPPGSPWYIQTDGPAAAVTLGDWYTSTTAGAGAGYHYLAFNVPCGWPSGQPVYVDLFSPEMNRVAGPAALSEEVTGNYDSTQFELYGPGASTGPGFALPAPGAGLAGSRITYQPGAPGVAEAWVRYRTLAAPVACGNYLIRSQVLAVDPLNPAGEGNDQNGWRARVGYDNDAVATNAPPANYDNPDGLGGTNDEITMGDGQVSYQHDAAGTICQTFYQYVAPSQPSVTFNNFDMDGSGRVRYYAPADPTYDPTGTTGGTAGTVSANGRWNGGTLATRAGNTIAGPASGWWRLVTCVNTHNQLIQEGQTGRSIYYAQPPTPTLTIAKTDGQAAASPGESLTYTLQVDNTSSGATAGAATNVVVTDTIPAGTTYGSCAVTTPASGTWACSQSGGVVTFSQTGWINAGAGATLTVSVTANQGITGSITNAAAVNYRDAMGNVFPQRTATDVDTIVAHADLAIVKSDSADPVDPGDPFDYDLVVTNNGPANATGLTVTDNVPAGLTVTGVSSPAGSCSAVGNAVTCTRATLNDGAAWTIHVHVMASATDPGATYNNTASVTGTLPDPVSGNDSDGESTTVRAVADLGVSKTDSVDPADPGDPVDYTLTATNAGPATATNAVLTDVVPAGLSVTGVTTGVGSCSFLGDTVTCTRASFPSGGTWSVTVHATVDANNGGGVFTDTASITSDQPDRNAANDSDTEDTTVRAIADLGIVKSDSADPVDPGDPFDYTLVVTNDGPADATGLDVTDDVPPGLTVLGANSPGPGSCSFSANTVSCTRAALVNAASWTIVVNVVASSTDPGTTYANTASVSGSEIDLNPVNDSDTEDTTVTTVANLSIAKTDSVDPADPGDAVDYTLVVSNAGPANATNVTVTDTVPAGITVTGVSTGAGSCSFVGNDVTCTLGTLANGGTWTVVVHAAVDASNPGGVFTDTASVDADQVDRIPGDDTDTEDTTVNTIADLGIVKTDSADPLQPGDAFSYTLTVTNHGPADATGVHITDLVPAGLSVTGVNAVGPGACTATGNDVDCTRASLVSGATWTIDVDVHTSAADPGTTYTNTASVAGDQADPLATNDSDSEDTTVTAVADLGVTKSDSVDPALPGQVVDYTITVTNAGPATATNVGLTDTVPAGLTVTGATVVVGSCSLSGNDVSCGRASLANGATWIVTVHTTVDGSNTGGTFTDIAAVAADQTDPDAANDTASEDTVVSIAADLEIVKTDSADPLQPGDAFGYTLTVTNHGPADATAVHIADLVPSGLTVTGVTSTSGTCGAVGNVVDCTLASLPNGATWTVDVSVQTSVSDAGTVYTNTATVDGTELDPVAANDSDGETTTVGAVADLAISKDDSLDPALPGQDVDYVLTVTNAGPADATNVVVTDAVPAGLLVTGANGGAGTCGAVGNDVTCTRGSLATGAVWIVLVHVTVDPENPGGTFTDTAGVSADQTDGDLTDNVATEDTTVPAVADLGVDKTADIAQPNVGDRVTYTITVTNQGPADASGVVVSDPLPSGLTFVSSHASLGTYDAGIGIWSVGQIADEGSEVLTVVTTVDADADGQTIVNRARVSASDQSDPTPGNDTGTGTVDVRGAGGGGHNDGDGDVNGTGNTASTGANTTGPVTAILLLLFAGALALAASRRRRGDRAN